VSFFRDVIRSSDDQKRRDAQLRRQGYDDGYWARPAKHLDPLYQTAWRRGREARDREMTA